MKQVLLASTLLLLATSGYLGCKLYKCHRPPAANCTSIKCDYSSSSWPGKIDARMAQIMADNYKADSQKALISIDNRITKDSDARSVWFSLENIKSYIWAIENQNCLNADCHKDTLGLRIYFAKYPDADSPDWTALGLAGLPSTYANCHTIFMIPTYTKGGLDIDFDPWSSNCAGSSHDIKNFNPADGANHIRAANVFFADPDGKNHGSLIPPGAETGTSF